MSLSGGLQHFLGHDIILPCNLDEAHDTAKSEWVIPDLTAPHKNELK